jgi:hypothetical protein
MTTTVVSLVSTTTHNLFDIFDNSYLGNIFGQLLRDGNNLTAATEEQIQKLQKIPLIKECSICQTVE